ncbi:hypothetical protein ACH429_08340 [Streptomyces pathocidini]|uniref:BACON domain-containing protein n=2 Tax=Streptomyces pathocidini TaxID=1650571 RepID=A0ABW7UQY6_9ACTN
MSSRQEQPPQINGAHRAYRRASAPVPASRGSVDSAPGRAGAPGSARPPAFSPVPPLGGPAAPDRAARDRAARDRAGHDRGAPDRAGQDPAAEERLAARYAPYLDGLFTYCLSVLCEHEAATAVLGEVLAIAERQYGRRPTDEDQRRAWLYALARWACLQRLAQLAESRRTRGARPAEPALSEAAATHRQRELGVLAWPEAAGITPEQREALELAVRHRLTTDEVAAVLGLERGAACALLSSAACEVERTRAALVVVERGNCPVVARLTGDSQVLLGTALRRELVRHVDDCAECRLAAERATAGGPWPGSTALPGTLPVLEAPRAAVFAAMVPGPRVRARGGAHAGAAARGGPRYDRSGFPLDPKDRVERRRRIRSRAVTTTVVATVVAAPVLALWAAYRGAPLLGETEGGGAVTAADAEDQDGLAGHPYEEAGNAQNGPDPRFTAGSQSPDVSVEVVDGDGRGKKDRAGDRQSSSATPSPVGPGRPSASRGPGRLTVEAQPSGDLTLITLRASGGSPVRWTASANEKWLQLNRTAGELRPGESVTITVSVDEAVEPEGPWTGKVAIGPSGTVITIHGEGATPEPTTPTPTPTPSEPTPTPTPTPPTPTPTPTQTENSGSPSSTPSGSDGSGSASPTG